MLNSFIGKKEICQEMLKHTAVKYAIGDLTMRLAERWGWLFIRLFGFPLITARRLRDRITFANLPKKGKILDVGCSFGAYSFPLAIKGYSVVGVDLNEESILLANKIKSILKLGNVTFFNKDITNFVPSSEKFDAIMIIEVLEHIKEDAKLIRYLRGILKQGGILIASAPFAEVVEEYGKPIPATISKDGKLVRIGIGGVHYRNGYNLTRFSKILEENGFSILKHEYTSLPDKFPNVMFLFPITYPIAMLLNMLSTNKMDITVVAMKN